MRFVSLPERLELHTAVDQATGCWNWTGYASPKGYAFLTFKGRSKPVHRWSWMVHRGDIPQGLELDHLCRNRICINPEHLEPVTHLENIRRGIAARPPRPKKPKPPTLSPEEVGRRAGLVGGPARAAALSSQRRREIARMGAAAMWAKKRAERLDKIPTV